MVMLKSYFWSSWFWVKWEGNLLLRHRLSSNLFEVESYILYKVRLGHEVEGLVEL